MVNSFVAKGHRGYSVCVCILPRSGELIKTHVSGSQVSPAVPREEEEGKGRRSRGREGKWWGKRKTTEGVEDRRNSEEMGLVEVGERRRSALRKNRLSLRGSTSVRGRK